MRTRLLALSLTVALAVGLGAVPAGAETVVVPTPVPAGVAGTTITDVACASATICFAVGGSQTPGGTRQVLMRGTGTTWVVASPPAPPGATATSIESVTCPSTASCWAAGRAVVGGVTTAHTLRWNGSAWSLGPVPTLPPGTVSSRLRGIDCPSTTECWAVGETEGAAPPKQRLVLRGNGTTWTTVTTPSPVGAGLNYLNDVTCVSATACWAVGLYAVSSINRALVLRWNGTAWAVSANPTPTAGTSTNLLGVSCASTTFCFAVGGAFDETEFVDRTLVLRWNGTAWVSITTALPSGTTSSFLNGVDCVTASACRAVGEFASADFKGRRLALTWNGSTWAVTSTPMPTASTYTGLYGVSCVTATDCWAAGIAEVDDIFLPLIVRLGDVPAPSPAVVPTPVPADSTDTYLRDVWCVTATSCWAVGAATIDGTGTRMVMRSAGNTWGIVNTPTLPGTLWSTFMGVTCTSATDCWAVGYAQIGSVNRPLIVRWNGTAWSLVTAPAIDDATLESVACTSTTNCWSVGTIRSDGVPDTRLVLRWNGTTWTPVTTALPSGTTSSDLHDVTCTGASACWAVGGFVGAAGPRRLILRWNGTSWTVVTTPLPSGSTDSFAASVSCGSSTSCVVAGGAFVSGAPRQMILRWNGSTWTADTVPAVSGSEATIFFGVSCATATTCTAVGAIQIAGVVRRSFARWNGTAWTHIATPLPTGTVRSEMGGISCTGATACTGVGMSRVGYDHALVIRIT